MKNLLVNQTLTDTGRGFRVGGAQSRKGAKI